MHREPDRGATRLRLASFARQRTRGKKNYLVTLRQACHALGFIPRVGISSSGHSGFDYVTVGAQRCAIQSINAINPAEQADLTEARLVESAPDSGS